MLIIFLIYSFIIGAMVGSFLTAWIWRVRNGKSMLDKHSVCPNCGHELGPLDLVPIFSWLLLKGKCRYCHQPISAQYVLIELSTAILFALATVWISSHLISPALLLTAWPLASLLFSWAIAALLVALFVYDLRWGELPDIWTLGGAGLSLCMIILAVLFGQPLLWRDMASYEWVGAGYPDLINAALSGIAAAIFFYLVVWGSERVLHKPGMGLGDVKLALFMGLFLGFPNIVVAIYVAFILGAMLSLFLIAGKRKSWGQSLPFGPFLIIGMLVSIWLTPLATSWYLALLL